MNLINNNKYKIFYINPKNIKSCTKESKFCDYTQFGKNTFHPHAGNNRGVFEEDKNGLIKLVYSDWDKPGIEFVKLLEFKALKDHYIGKQKWRESDFALRFKKYIKILQSENSFIDSKLFKNLKKYFKNSSLLTNPSKINNLFVHRENLIEELFESISKNGIHPLTKKTGQESFVDNISINVGKGSKIFFNNRGHHRLSIAKILNLKLIPVKITVVRNEKILRDFIFKYEK